MVMIETKTPRVGVRMRCLRIVVLCLLLPGPAIADEFASQREALQIIKDTAKTTCDEVGQSGSETQSSIAGKLGAQLPGLSKKLLDLGVAGAARLQTENYQGVVREQLAEAMKQSSECRLEVLKTLVGIVLLPPPAAQQHATQGPLTIQLIQCESALSDLQCVLVVSTTRGGSLQVVGPYAESGLQSEMIPSSTPLPYTATAAIDRPNGPRFDYVQPGISRRVYLTFQGLPADTQDGQMTLAFLFDREPGRATFRIGWRK